MIELDQAIHGALVGDATLTGQLAAGTASVFYGSADRQSDPPLVTFAEASGVPAYTLGARAWEDFVYVVKAITEGESFALAKTLRDRIDEILSDATLTVSGHENLYLRRESSIEMVEDAGGRRFNHAAGQFRIWAA